MKIKLQTLLKHNWRTLLLLCTLMTFCQEAWSAFDNVGEFYFKKPDSWSKVYMITGHSTYSRADEMTSAGDGYYCVWNSFNDATAFFFANTTCGVSTNGESKDINNVTKTNNCTKTFTSSPSIKCFIPSSASGTNIDGEWKFGWSHSDVVEVLKGNKIMFFIGELASCNQIKFTVVQSSTVKATTYNVITPTPNQCSQSGLVRMGPVLIASGTYTLGHDGWSSGSGNFTSEAGKYYFRYGDRNVCTTGGTSKTASMTLSTSTIEYGSNVSISTHSVTSAQLGLTSEIKYYATSDDNSFTELSTTNNGNTLVTSSLATGSWKIYPMYYDKIIYCKGNSVNLTINPACTHLDDEDYSIYITGTDPHSTTTTYDGSAKSVTLTAVTTGAPTNGTISYTGTGSTSYSKNTDAPSGAGTYAITYTVGASGGFCAETDLGLGSITISQASQSAPTVNGISPSVGPGDYTLSATGGTAGYYYYEIVSEGTTGTASIVNNGTETVTLSVTTVGDIYVKAKRLGNNNYAESDYGSATKLTFTKADQGTAVAVSDMSAANLCGLGLKNLSATGGNGTGYYSYQIVDGGTGTATITDNETASVKLNVTAVGSIKIRAKRLDDDNYNVSSYGDTKTFTFKNSGSLSDFVVTGAEKKYYTGSPISVSVTSDVYSSITVKYNGSTTAPTNPGSYPVTITTAATDTYCAVTNLAAGTLVIKVFIRMIDNKREEWKWNDVKMHYWGGTCSGSSCPGSAMTSEGSNVWTMELDCVPAGLLFDNGTCSGSNMTVDATYTVGKCYEVVDDKTSEKHNVNLIECSCSDPTISASPSGSSWTKCANVSEAQRQISVTASGGTGTLTYQWYRNSVASTSGAVAVTDMVEGGNTYAPSASDEGTFYYYCVVRSGGYCSANSATSGFSGALTILDTPVIQPAAPDVKQYEPVKLTSTNSRVTWSVSPVASETGYLYEQTQKSVTFKGQTGSYTVTATPASGSGCTSTSSITVSNDDSEGC